LIGFTFVKPDEYQDLRGFYEKVSAADQGQLVLALDRTAPAGSSVQAGTPAQAVPVGVEH
jgi:hypothetical protein